MRCLLKVYSLNNRHVCELSNHLSKALSYLHKNLIVHRVCSWPLDRSHISPYRELQDISHDNIVINHFCAAAQIRSNTMRGPLRSAGHLVYALLDFDISIQFPPNSTPADMRLPSFLSWWGSYNKPADTALGELDYDPFAFDVGCLGVLFWNRFGVSWHSSTV
jgi:serine/threonine protein kinase